MLYTQNRRFIAALVLSLALIATAASGQDVGVELEVESEEEVNTGGSFKSFDGGFECQEVIAEPLADHFLDLESLQQCVDVTWEDPEMDTLGNSCRLRGSLRIRNAESGQYEAITWAQGITVIIAPRPFESPDWSKVLITNSGWMDSENRDNALMSRGLCNSDGTFDIAIDIRQSDRDRNATQLFQVGLSLAHHQAIGMKHQSICWTSSSPPVERSVCMLELPADSPIDPALKLVNLAAGWPSRTATAVEFIRAANALQALGKNRALEVLEEYARLSGGDSTSPDNHVIFWLVRVLFEPVRLDERMECPVISARRIGAAPEGDANWPFDPIMLVNNIPFRALMGGGFGGGEEPPESYIAMARQSCVMRDEPLKPVGNPLMVAEWMCRSKQFGHLGQQTECRNQAIAMLGGILEPIVDRIDCEAVDPEPQWRERLAESERLGIRWDSASESFIAANRVGHP